MRDVYPGNGPGRICLQLLREDVVALEDCVDFFSAILERLERVADYRYAFIHRMATIKLPATYFLGISSQHLTRREDENMVLWAAEAANWRNVVRGLYWGNVFCPAHFRTEQLGQQGFAERVTSDCNQGTLLSLGGGRLCLFAPFPVATLQMHEYDQQMARFSASIRPALQACAIRVLP